MTKIISLKIKKNILEDMETISKQLKIPRNTYIAEALDFYNALNHRKSLGKKLQRKFLLVRKSAAKRNNRVPTSLRGSVLVEKDIVNAMERRHRQGYVSHPYPKKEVNLWGKEQAWGSE